ncbi:MAG: hypothetical protein J0M04_05815 [Verrucomicrobia bacterium]|nr:hypothetical protein [Verrucomicrobiota bacterium]
MKLITTPSKAALKFGIMILALAGTLVLASCGADSYPSSRFSEHQGGCH